jgi:peptide/nickel transport system substrate-binding protein
VHDYLVVQDTRNSWIPRIAVEQLSVEKGTWRINADGTMDTAWKIRPNVKWHDGTPFTSADLLFTFTAFKDPDLPSRYGEALALMQSAEAPDPQTFIVRWSGPYASADQAPGLNPMPNHLLEETYRTNKANFGSSTRFSSEFIGLGPYKMTRWEPNSHIEFTRFDDYFLGHPPLDSVIVRFIEDPNALVANMLAGAVDVIQGRDVPFEAALEVRRRWEGNGNQVLFTPSSILQQMEMQYRVEYSRPRNGLTNLEVRQALYSGIDRPTLVESVAQGLAPVADSWFAPNHALRAQVESAIPQYPYNVTRAQRLLAQAGWQKGPDGILVHSPSGERFELELLNQDRAKELEQGIVADYWRQLGIQVSQQMVPNPRNRELEAIRPGPIVTGPRAYDFPYNSRLHSKNTSSVADRWAGRNRGAYNNPRVDSTLDRLAVTIDQRETVTLHRQLLQDAMGDVALMPLYFHVNPVLMLAGVRGPTGADNEHWNFFEWNKD